MMMIPQGSSGTSCHPLAQDFVNHCLQLFLFSLFLHQYILCLCILCLCALQKFSCQKLGKFMISDNAAVESILLLLARL